MKIGFVGLGAMGSAMARNLLKAGHEVTVYNRTRARAEELAREGAEVAGSPGETASAEFVITMLADDRALEDVLLGSGSLLSKLGPDHLHVSMSTISVELSRNLVEAHRRHGTGFVSAPVFGRPDAAEAAKLFIVAAGPKPAIAKCKPLFSAMGQKTFVLGEDPVAANVVKLSGNFLIVSTLECMGEAFALVRKHGIDPQQYLEILTNSFFSAPFHKNYGGIIAHEKYEPAGFRLKLGLKDVRLIVAAADAANVPMPVASVLHNRFLAGVSRGLGEKDWSAIAQLEAESAGLN
ncbi:MAG TPA: NAD(P)-dependent oxidoreductase [Terriglobales bacterium]|nr:NAD(P)-dependent oxidoreductase [Terriglobales bacterium]